MSSQEHSFASSEDSKPYLKTGVTTTDSEILSQQPTRQSANSNSSSKEPPQKDSSAKQSSDDLEHQHSCVQERSELTASDARLKISPVFSGTFVPPTLPASQLTEDTNLEDDSRYGCLRNPVITQRPKLDMGSSASGTFVQPDLGGQS